MFPWLFPQIPIDSGGVPTDGGETKPGDIEPSIGRDMTVELKCDSITVSLIVEIAGRQFE